MTAFAKNQLFCLNKILENLQENVVSFLNLMTLVSVVCDRIKTVVRLEVHNTQLHTPTVIQCVYSFFKHKNLNKSMKC